MTQSATGAIPHSVSVARLPQNGMPVKLTANDKELKLLAKAHDLVSVTSFSADLLVKKWRKDGVKITGTVKASVVQSCIVTLEPIHAVVENEIDTLFVPENSKLARAPLTTQGEIVIDYDGPDMPETFVGDTIDVGALAEEFFELGIDPYPRKEGASFDSIIETEEVIEKKPSPFAKLVNFRKD